MLGSEQLQNICIYQNKYQSKKSIAKIEGKVEGIIRYSGAAVTDTGNLKKNNQDSVCLKIVNTRKHGQIALGVLCDGMGGLEKGELASAEVIRTFESWFDNQLPGRLSHYTWEGLAADWHGLLTAANDRLLGYGRKHQLTLGTTASAILILEEKYMIVHVGDSRIYRIKDSEEQLTADQTFIAREMKLGHMTERQARRDSRRHALLQCVGASETVKPDILYGSVEEDSMYLLCSDGFWQELKAGEMYQSFRCQDIRNPQEMAWNLRHLIGQVKRRKEKDNISAVLIKCEG